VTTVYIAASSADIDRAEHWRDRLVAVGVRVVGTWMANIRTVGDANPRTASADLRSYWSRTCLEQVADADAFWLLVPGADKPTAGAWIELGYALGCDLRIVCSGDTKRSIFCALGDEYASDEDAFAAVVARCAP
jgi:hypothetical protein